MASICVIGAGVIGLSTANCLLDHLPDCEVTIVAEKFLDQTTSIGAAGCFGPKTIFSESFDDILQWSKASWDHFAALHERSKSSTETGVFLINGYEISKNKEYCQSELLKRSVPNIKRLNDIEMKSMFSNFKTGFRYKTFMIDPRYYLPYLTEQFKSRGGLVIERKVHKLNEDKFLTNFDAIVNCSGLGSRHLVDDHMMVPIRGQTVKVYAPWMKHFIFSDGLYIYPSADGLVTLGGIKQFGTSSMEISDHDRKYILDGCYALEPELRKAPIVQEWVGLRPFRPFVRVESETVKSKVNDELLRIVHNYGHGGDGIALSWGTSEQAVKLIKKFLENLTDFKSKL